MCMMIVMPAFAEGHKGHPPVVAGIIARGETARAPHVRGGVHQPRGVEPDNNAEANAPQQHGKSADGEEQAAQDDDGNPVIVVQRNVERMPRQIGRIFRHHSGVVVIGFAEKDPTDMRPPRTLAGRMRIAGLIGLLMMDTMGGHPEDGPAFQRQGAANGKEILKPDRHFVGPVRVQPMVSHADAQAGTHVVKENGGREITPAEPEQGGNSSDVQQYQYDGGDPIYPLAIGHADDFSGH